MVFNFLDGLVVFAIPRVDAVFTSFLTDFFVFLVRLKNLWVNQQVFSVINLKNFLQTESYFASSDSLYA